VTISLNADRPFVIYLAPVSRYHSYLNTAKAILQQFKGEEPFASFLKKYFSLHKKHGSKDRKRIAHLCYSFFRLGKLHFSMPVEERLLLGLFLCSYERDEILELLRPAWNEHVESTVQEKLAIASGEGLITDVFPWPDELSDGIYHEKFAESFFMQPDLFLRIRPGKERLVKEKLKNAEIDFSILSETCIALPNSTKIDSVIELNKEAVVQDYNSQRVGELFDAVRPAAPAGSLLRAQGRSDQVWDCCAASGGKSIMLHDLYPDIDLTVSDIRESIISNLKKRFNEAGIKNYRSVVADLTAPDFRFKYSDFDLIIADVPCTGSGTWSRTPEQLYYFEKEKISEYASLQERIISNVIPQLKPGGFLLYITCSVFKKENEDIIDFIKQKSDLHLLKMEVLNGYGKKADTMFAAVLQKASKS